MSLAYKFPDFIDYIQKVADEFRDIYATVSQGESYKFAKVAVLNSWGKLRTWAPYTVAHGKWYKLSYSYMGMMEALAGMDVDIDFINFDDVKMGRLKDYDVLINAGDAYNDFSGGEAFLDPEVIEKIRAYVYEGGGFIGLGDPSAYQKNGKFFQLSDVLGLDVEKGFSQSNNKYSTEVVENHFILADQVEDLDFGESKKDVYAISKETEILEYSNNEVHMAAKSYGRGRSFYMAGMPYSRQNTRILRRAIAYVTTRKMTLKNTLQKI